MNRARKNRAQVITNALLLLLVLGSALGVVYSKYLSRKYFVGLERLRKEREQVEIEWGRLQLEQSTLATHGRVEKKARGELGMLIPDPEKVVIIKP